MALKNVVWQKKHCFSEKFISIDASNIFKGVLSSYMNENMW
jgi:hypothetical protein